MTIQQLINLNIYDDYEKIVVIARNDWSKYKIVCKTYLCEIPNKYKKLNVEAVSALSEQEKSKYYIRSRDGFTCIYVVEDVDDINEIDYTDKERQVKEVADKLRRTSYDRWNYDLCRQLCKLAGLSDEWKEVDTGDIEDVVSVVYKAADILGVTV